MRSNMMQAYGAPPGVPEGYELEALTTPYVHDDQESAEAFVEHIVQMSEERGYVVQAIQAVEHESNGLWAVYIEYWRPPVGGIRSGEHTLEETVIRPGHSNTEEKQGWPWYAYAGIGLGAVAVVGVVYMIYKGSK
jgi:hypothetical protein